MDIALLLPPGVVWVSGEVDGRGRDAEHRAGRRRAEDAVRRLGRALPPADGGRTRFPDGVVGSVTHDGGFAAATAARVADGWAALGVDLHCPRPLTAADAAYVADPRELARASAAVGTDHAPHLLFALKEAVFKALSDLDGRWLEFADIRVLVRANGRARLVRPRGGRVLLRWGRSQQGFAAAALVRARGARRGSA